MSYNQIFYLYKPKIDCDLSSIQIPIFESVYPLNSCWSEVRVNELGTSPRSECTVAWLFRSCSARTFSCFLPSSSALEIATSSSPSDGNSDLWVTKWRRQSRLLRLIGTGSHSTKVPKLLSAVHLAPRVMTKDEPAILPYPIPTDMSLLLFLKVRFQAQNRSFFARLFPFLHIFGKKKRVIPLQAIHTSLLLYWKLFLPTVDETVAL